MDDFHPMMGNIGGGTRMPKMWSTVTSKFSEGVCGARRGGACAEFKCQQHHLATHSTNHTFNYRNVSTSVEC